MYIEISVQHPLSTLDAIEIKDLKNLDCILISNEVEKENEAEFYRNTIGIPSAFRFAKNLEQARMQVVARKGYMPIEAESIAGVRSFDMKRIQLLKNGKPILRNYCAFWKKDNSGYYIEEFASILKTQFDKTSA